MINPNALLVVALTTVVGAALSHALLGLLAGLVLVFIATTIG